LPVFPRFVGIPVGKLLRLGLLQLGVGIWCGAKPQGNIARGLRALGGDICNKASQSKSAISSNPERCSWLSNEFQAVIASL
jgi:hypothetical protein